MSESMFMPADWPVPASIRAGSTLRTGGVSSAPFDSLNLGAHVDDDPADVAKNRALLRAHLDLPGEPLWLNQVHGTVVCDADARDADDRPAGEIPAADAAITRRKNTVLAVLTADCLPLVFYAPDPQPGVLGVAHGGWRGLAGGVAGATLRAMDADPATVTAWLGPAIGPECFEVGDDVRHLFVAADRHTARYFAATANQTFMANLYALARRQLQELGISAVFGGGRCTYTERQAFYSYRREQRTGRMATLAWMT